VFGIRQLFVKLISIDNYVLTTGFEIVMLINLILHNTKMSPKLLVEELNNQR